MLCHLLRLDLPQEALFMIETDPMRGHVHVKEAEFTNQRLLPLAFTPGADDFHNDSNDRAKLMPHSFT